MDNPTFPIALAALKKAKTANERIDALPLPMVFKGTLGTGGTVSTLPTASSENEGFVYIVITDGTYAGTSAKAGDTFVSDGSSWVLVPSADEPSPIDDSVISTTLTWSSKKINDECKIKSFTYIGNGQTSNSITFPEKPKMIIGIYGSDNVGYLFTGLSFPYGFEAIPIGKINYTAAYSSQPSYRYSSVSYADNVITITSDYDDRALNVNGYEYTVYYI